ncbi:hypothetical protein C8F04DRAFT_1174802 [Mycena alexandri]|nr:hypothetical protein C8F04DRAFT_1174802 [Mycena alexandri]
MALGALAITPPVPNTIVPVEFAGNAAAIQAPAFGEDTRIYYQADVSGGILELAVSGPATVGKVFSLQTLIPAAQVQPCTLIAAVITDGVDFTGVRLSFRAVEIAQGRPPTMAGGGHYLYGGHRPPLRPPRRLHRLSPPSSSPLTPSPAPLPSRVRAAIKPPPPSHHPSTTRPARHTATPAHHPDTPARRPDPRPRP